MQGIFLSFAFSVVSIHFISSTHTEYTKEAQHDRITSLPRATELKSNQFSGFLDITATKNLHYVYFESENNPENDSIIFWTNGGPGCSGLLGLFTEFGPWRPVANGSLVYNPYSWTKLASLVFLEQPVGVGFSYGTNGDELQSFNDFRAAGDNLLAIKSFFKRYPERASQPFYLASESYGGHYIPQWTLQVLEDASLRKRFKGMLVGNPYTSYTSGSVAMANALWGLQMVPKPAWDEFVADGCDDLGRSPYSFMETSPQCFEMMYQLFDYAGPINPYALSFPVCSRNTDESDSDEKRPLERGAADEETEDATGSRPWMAGLSRQERSLLRIHQRITASAHFKSSLERFYESHPHRRGRNLFLQRQQSEEIDNSAAEVSIAGGSDGIGASRASRVSPPPPRHRRGLSAATGAKEEERTLHYDPCTQDYTTAYLNDPLVQAALHVLRPDPTDPSTQITTRWAECDDTVNGHWSFSDYLSDTTALYGRVYQHAHKPKGFKMLVFSGDVDGVCATVGTQHWVFKVASSEVRSLYQPWMYHNAQFGSAQVGGYLTQFSDWLAFVTVRHAGHEVPAYQPEIALELFSRFLDGSFFAEHSGGGGSQSNSGGSDSSGTTGAMFPDLLSQVVAFIMLTLGVAGVVVGSVAYWRSLRAKALASQEAVEEEGL